MKTRALLIVALCQFLISSQMPASIIGGGVTSASGAFVLLTPPLANPFGPPNTVGLDNFETTNLFGFNELQDVVLVSNLFVDVGISPIPAGTVVSSHYVFFDPATNSPIAGMVGFDTNVLGIITSTTNLANSDYLAAPGVNFAGPSARGLEDGDSAMISVSFSNVISVQLFAGSPGDYIRVITMSTKMPGPVVVIEPSETNCVVSWPTNQAGFTLQFATSLSNPIQWTNHPVKPVIIQGQFKITNSISGNARFFRLMHQ